VNDQSLLTDAIEILVTADEKFITRECQRRVGFVVELVGGENFELWTFFEHQADGPPGEGLCDVLVVVA